MNSVNALCQECGAFIERWFSGTPRVCRECLAGPAGSAADRVEPVAAAAEKQLLHPMCDCGQCSGAVGDQIIAQEPLPAIPGDDELLVWYPGHVSIGSEWAAAARDYLDWQALAEIPDSGVCLIEVLVLVDAPITVPDPLWSSAIPEFDRAWPPDLPEGSINGFRFPAPLVAVAVHQAYLRRGEEPGYAAAD